ncbi:MAG: hypothetical protein R2838_19960 [Caldilineaceae bacterium]
MRGYPVGEELGHDVVPAAQARWRHLSSIIVVIIPTHPCCPSSATGWRSGCGGPGRVGGIGRNGGGDIFWPSPPATTFGDGPRTIPRAAGAQPQMDLFFGRRPKPWRSPSSTMAMAETMTGFQDRTVRDSRWTKLREIADRSW